MSNFVAPGVEKLGRQHYRVWWSERMAGRSKQRSKQVRMPLADAIAFRVEQIDAQRRGEYVSPSAMTLGDYLGAWVDKREAMGEVSAHTVHLDRARIEHICTRLGDRPLQELTKAEIEDYYVWCLKNEITRHGELVSKSTVHKRHKMLKKALEDATQEEPPLIQRNPAARAKHPEAPRPNGVAFTRDEAQIVLAAVHDSWLDIPVRTALHTGLRVGEILALRTIDIDLEKGLLTVSGTIVEDKDGFRRKPYPKTSHSRRTVSMGDELTATLKKHLREQAEKMLALGAGRDERLVVCGAYGQMLRPSKVSARFSPVIAMLEDAGELSTTGATFHSLRHTHATLLLRAGVPVHIVSQRLGHSRIQITLDYYGHVMPSDDENAARTIGDVLSEPHDGATVHGLYTEEPPRKTVGDSR